MQATLPSFAIIGIDALPLAVEVDCVDAKSLDSSSWTVVGLGDAAIRESRERVKAALKNSGFSVGQKRVTVNLAPADVKKEGSHLDLPMALAILTATGRIDPRRAARYGSVGELGLDGGVKPVPGALPMAIGARDEQLDGLIVPEDNAPEAAWMRDVPVIPVRTLMEAVSFLRGELDIAPAKPIAAESPNGSHAALDFCDVRGQESAKRALEIAAAGGHNIVMVGPPGSGKTMLAKRIPTILPAMTFEEAIETTKIFSISGLLDRRRGLIRERPFRSPHHTASHVALVGGGAVPKPGEVSLSHNGVLFLDEFAEFSRNVLEVMRQPLEDAVVTISRAQMTLQFPASFMLCAAMNPCPCGYAGHPEKECVCNPQAVARYFGRISGPLLDRIDLHVGVNAVTVDDMQKRKTGEPSATIRERVQAARDIQKKRFDGREGMFCNAQLTSKDIETFCALEPQARDLLGMAMKRLNLSARAYDRVLKVSRTIADLNASETVQPPHISEAVQYRNLDRGV